MNKLILIIICFLAYGCASMGMPGTISETVSGFDGAAEISMEPGFVYEAEKGYGGIIKLGLLRSTRMESDMAVLKVMVRGAHNFADGKSFSINIDGEVIELESIDVLTDIELVGGVNNRVAYIPGSNWSSRRYEVHKDLVGKMIKGEVVWVRLGFSKNYAEGLFSREAISTAKRGFKKFYEKVWEE